ncbi:NAD(P)/FAD-dependent oxidoreductase [Amycolatopsis sp. SID8362]|uniref:NAD(P)/FAD-dependent oxidoreductase n=1 Tax=Amycolatopsis sp. SID8362 TaxID=2690346 RepID=UPI001370A803|nr:NAD(P)/FAD-dependent oxidoreductase [Amycolatopsis sp. SID8362]NBH10954.1 FAD-dependent oxidoreductase [Amycolatopsis sp. SID8362]NED47645.1 NAD(P)/FAD-dependent oxidoreductase [Amycolatopsis sp. SID8362]
MSLDTDILLVGAGPTGLYGAYCAGFRGLRTVVVDGLPQPGGQIAALYPEKEILDVAGLPRVRGRDFVAALLDQAGQYNPEYLLGRQAVALGRAEDGRPEVTLSDGSVIRAGAVILTAGIGTFTPRKLPAGEDYLGRGLSYFVTDPDAHTGQNVLVVGGGDSAVDWALALEPIAKSVTLVHRRSAFRAHAASVTAVSEGATRIVTDAEVEALSGEETLRLAHVRVRGEERPRLFEVDSVIAALGFVSNLGPLTGWGLQLRGRSILVDSRMRTSLDRVYAAGDVTEYEGKVRLMSVGFGEVATAVNNAAVALDSELTLFPGHSTENS